MVEIERYFQPESLEEAIKLLRRYGAKAKIMAGGTDLVYLLKAEKVTPQYIISINFIPGLDRIEMRDGGMRLGARVNLNALLESPEVKEKFPCLIDAILPFASTQIRNMATVGGNLCHAAPSADMAPPLIVLGTKAEIAGPRGKRSIPLEDFFVGPNRTVLKPNEMLVSLRLPNPPPGSGSCYFKHAIRGAMEIAFVGVAAYVRLKDGRCDDVRIALGAVAPTPMRASEAERALKGKELTDEAIVRSAELAAQECRPISDVRCSAEYRREMVKVFTRRAINLALKRARGD